MNILLIQTGTTKLQQEKMGEGNMNRVNMPMLGLLYIAAFTPEEHQVTVIDETNGPVEHFEKYDIVGISGMTMHANRMYALADEYRKIGCHVVLGGVHVSFMTEEALQHCDTVMVKEGELSWQEFLRDFEEGRPKRIYQPKGVFDLCRLPKPDLSLVDGPAYKAPRGTLNSIVATRGCPNHCAFCCVRKLFDGPFRIRTADSIVEEIAGFDENIIIFQDDNIVGNFAFAKELFTRMIPMKRLWGAQGSINVAANRELLDLMADSGCRTLFVGFESVNRKNLAAMGKSGVNRVEDYEENIKRLHDKGIRIFGSFIVGLDDDEESVFDDIYEFCCRNKIDFPIVNCLTPFPGTETYSQLQAEGRIIDRDWSKYNLTNVVIRPKSMEPDKLQFQYNMLVHYLNKMTYANMQKLHG
ncbi:MAG: B12-binding domain-containing radical SAM protein [Anaerovoracaceae bacterium]